MGSFFRLYGDDGKEKNYWVTWPLGFGGLRLRVQGLGFGDLGL